MTDVAEYAIPVGGGISWRCAACGFRWKRYEEHSRTCPHATTAAERRRQRAHVWRQENEEAQQP